MSRRRTLLILIGLVGYLAYGFLSAGCMNGEPCMVDAECTPGVCTLGFCTIGLPLASDQCVSDGDTNVGPGHRCEENSGEVREPAGPNSCPVGQTASDRTGDCEPTATGPADCAAGEQAIEGQCTPSPCADTPFDTCPRGSFCETGLGACVSGAKVCGPVPNPIDEVCLPTGEIRDRCPQGGDCPIGQTCGVNGFCEPIVCTVPDGFECTGGSVCDAGECIPDCDFGCPLFETCNQRTGVCENDSIYAFSLPATTTYYADTADPHVTVVLPVYSGQILIHRIEIDLTDGLTVPTFDTLGMTISFDGYEIQPSLIDTATAHLDADLDGVYDEGEEIVLARVSPTRVVVTLPDGGNGLIDVSTSPVSRTIWMRVPVNAPGSDVYTFDVVATQIDATTRGVQDHLLPDPTTASESYSVDVSPDSDGDGIPDSQEIAVFGTDPNDDDTDRDGAPDGLELDLELDPLDRDLDGNGWLDGLETLHGSDPLDPTSIPEPQIHTRYPAPRLFDEATIDSTAPILFEIDAADRAALWANPTTGDIHAFEITAGVPGIATLRFDASDIPAACGSYSSIESLDGLGNQVLVTATCTADGAKRVLAGPRDGSSDLSIVAEPGDAIGAETILQIHDATLAGTAAVPVLALTGARASGDFLALDPFPFDMLGLRATASDLSAGSFEAGQVEADGDVFVLTRSPSELVRLDLVGSGASGATTLIAAGTTPSPFLTTEGVTEIGEYAVGGGALAAVVTTSDAREGVLRIDLGTNALEAVAEVGRFVPGGTFGGTSPGIRNLSGLAVSDQLVHFDAQDQLNSNARYGHLLREDGTRSVVQKIFHPDDTFGASNATLVGPATGGRMSRTLSSRRSSVDHTLVTRGQFGANFEVVFLNLEAGPPVPVATMIAMRPAGSVTQNHRFLTSPPIFDRRTDFAASSLSGGARTPLDFTVRFMAGFDGGASPGIGGSIYSFGTGEGPLAFVGQTSFATAGPGLAFDAGGNLWASISTDSGFADTLASIDPATGADTVVAPFFESPMTLVEGIDALAWIASPSPALWAFTKSEFDGTPGDVLEVDTATAEVTRVANLPEALSNIVGASVSAGDEVFVSTGGSLGGQVGWVDKSAYTGAPGVFDLPLRILADIQIQSQSISDIIVLDSDGDGVDDRDEAALGTSATNADSDGDGLGDGAESLRLLLDPTRADTDGDGLDDGAERLRYRTNAAVADSDGDGFDDGVEIGSGTDPNDSQSFPTAQVPSIGSFGLGALLGLLLATSGGAMRHRAVRRVGSSVSSFRGRNSVRRGTFSEALAGEISRGRSGRDPRALPKPG